MVTNHGKSVLSDNLTFTTGQQMPTNVVDQKTGFMRLYAESGFCIFPLSKDRVPLVKAWNKIVEPDIEFDPNIYPYGYGIVLRDTDLVIDYDPRRDTENGKQLKEWLESIGIDMAEISTYVVRTGRGGLHIYFSKPAGYSVINTYLKDYPAIEIKTKGRYVIGPGSPHPQGVTYAVATLSLDKIAPASDAMLVNLKQEYEVRKSASALIDDSEINKQRFIKYCRTCAPAIEGTGGDTTTFKTACTGRDFGISEQIAFEIMADEFNPRCLPPWELDQLRIKVANAYSYAANTAGSSHPWSDFGIEPDELDLESIRNDGTQNVDSSDVIPSLDWDLIKTFNAKTGKTEIKQSGTTHNGILFFQCSRWRTCYPMDGSIVIDKTKPSKPNDIHQLVKYNELAGTIEFAKKAPWHKEYRLHWSDRDAVQLKNWFRKERDVTFSVQTIWEIVTVVAQENSYHPIRDYLNSLQWDGVERLNRMLPVYCGAEENPYVCDVGKNIMVGAVHRVFEPGCQHDEMLILEGPQGIGKTTFVQILGGDWFADVHLDLGPIGYVRTVSAMRGKWILEVSEMVVTRTADVSALNAFLTKKVDIVRLAYDRSESILPRQNVFIGTHNPTGNGYFKDPTGQRRFWPVVIHKVEMKQLRQDRDQLWAEAVHRYKQGEPHHITDEEVKRIAIEEQAKRLEVDPWKDIIENWLDTTELPDILATEYIAVMGLGIPTARMTKAESNRIAIAMRQLGWRQLIKKINGVSTRTWYKEPEIKKQITFI